MGRQKVTLGSTPESWSFTAYPAYPPEVAAEVQTTIGQTGSGLVFTTIDFRKKILT